VNLHWWGLATSPVCECSQRQTVLAMTWLDLIHPTSTWTYWATLRHHSCLWRAATFASSQVSPIPRRCFLTIPLQFVLGQPGPLLKPGTSQYSAWCVMRQWSIRIVWPSQRSLLPLRVFGMLCCPVLALTSSFVTLSLTYVQWQNLKTLQWIHKTAYNTQNMTHWLQSASDYISLKMNGIVRVVGQELV